MSEINKKRRYFPSSFLVIIGIMILFIIASWIGKAASDKITGVGILDVFPAIWKGFVGKVDVILFIFAIGGAIGVMTKIKAIDAGITALVDKLGDRVWLLIPSLMFIFGLGGTTYGMWEETIAFIPILIPVFKKAGYGPFTAILVILIGAGTGCLASTVNPFATGAAVNAIAGTKSDPGVFPTMTAGTMQGTRWVSFVIFELVAISVVTWISTRYRKAQIAGFKTDADAKAASKGNLFISFFTRGRVVEGIDQKIINTRFKETEKVEFTTKRKISLALFVLTFVLMIIMYLPWMDWINDSQLTQSKENYNKSMFWFASTTKSGFAPIGDWYFVSVASLFLISTIIIFALNFKDFRTDSENAEQGFINTYMGGIKDVTSVCLLIAVAGGLGIILKSTGFGELIAKESAKGLENWIAFGVVVFLVSVFLSLLIPSTSGFAAAFMPIFAAIAIKAFPENKETAIGIAMMGFLFANGLANFVTPTSAALMGYTSYAGVPYNVWIKQTWKVTFILFLLSFVLILGFSIAASGGSKLF